MNRLLQHARVSANLLFAAIVVLGPGSKASATADQAVLAADHAFVQAVTKSDIGTLDKLLEQDFVWTDADGKTRTRAEVLKALPKLALGDETNAQTKQLTYGEVSAVLADREKVHVLRIWVKRATGWRALVYQEVAQLEQAPAPSSAGAKDCENPCKTVPFEPKNESERAVIVSWQALETAVTNHDAQAWSPHVAEEFVMVSSSNDHPLSKADRLAFLNLQKQTAVSSAPAPLVSARMFDFADAIVMTCLHQPYTGKGVHVSRVWIKRNGQWVMAISYQTTIREAPAQ